MLVYQLIIRKVHLKRHAALTAEQASVPAVPSNALVPAPHSPWVSPESRIRPAGTQINWENEGLQASEGPSKAYAYKILLFLLCNDNICYQDTRCLPMGFMAVWLLLIWECLQLNPLPCRYLDHRLPPGLPLLFSPSPLFTSSFTNN